MASPAHQSRPGSSEHPSPPPSRATSSPSDRSPRKWYHRTLGRSLPGSPSGHAASQLRNLPGIRGLVRRTSRQALRASTSNRQLYFGNDRTAQQFAGTENRLPGDPHALRCCRPPTLINQPSDISSTESLTPDQSGISSDLSQPETPDSISSQIITLLGVEQVPRDCDMGNKVSSSATVIRKPVPAHVKPGQNLSIQGSGSLESPSSSQELPAEAAPPPILHHRASTVKVPIPRRRSSLTTLHLDRSHFEKALSPKHNKYDARASSLSDSFHPDPMSPNTKTSAPPSGLPATIPPALISPPLSNSRPSTAESQTESSTSQGPNHLRLPVTFPGGKIVTPTPPLTKTHYHCYQFHKRVRYSQNKTYPVPCMACGTPEGDSRWKCIWCALRICAGCMAELDNRGRDLEKLMEWVAQQDSKKKADGAIKDPNASQTTLTDRIGSVGSESRSRGGSVSTEKASSKSPGGSGS